MKILHLAPRFPFPEDDGGKISIAADLKMFAKLGCEIDFIIFSDESIPKKLINECEKYCKLHIIKYSTKNTPQRILSSIFYSKSLYIHKHLDDYTKSELKKIIDSSSKFDVIHCEHSAMAPMGVYAKELTGAKLGIRLQNVEYKIWQRYSENLSKLNPKAIYVGSQAKKLMKDEARLYQASDICFAITDIDKKAALDIAPNANVTTATAGIFPEKWLPSETCRKNNYELIIATTYNWVHNVTGLLWFIKNVMPELRKRIPEVTLSLIGKNPPDVLKEFEHLGVKTLGYIPSVQEKLNKAAIYIAPLFTGSGIRIKILEAMAMELPVVATYVSAEGITAKAGNGLFVSDNIEDWINTITELLNSSQATKTAGKEARKYILEHYTWETNVKIMFDAYREMV